jgi:hypothetical protein
MQASGRGFNNTAILQFTSDWSVILLNSAAYEDALEKSLEALIGARDFMVKEAPCIERQISSIICRGLGVQSKLWDPKLPLRNRESEH